jgi:uncharacterized membrane protein
MRTKKQRCIIFLGWILVIIGFSLSIFSFLGSNYGMYYFWDGLNTLSIILIVVGGIFLSTLALNPSNNENNPLETVELRYANGELTKAMSNQSEKLIHNQNKNHH